MATVEIKLIEKRDGLTHETTFVCEDGLQLGKRVRLLMKCKPGTLYSIDWQGHVQEDQGPIEDDKPICIRKGREFMRIEGKKK